MCVCVCVCVHACVRVRVRVCVCLSLSCRYLRTYLLPLLLPHGTFSNLGLSYFYLLFCVHVTVYVWYI